LGLHIRLDDSGDIVTVDPQQYRYLSYDYATTVHRSQGQTREQAFHLAAVGMTDRHLSLVAITRARDSYRLYGAENDLEAIAERLGLDRQKVNALEEGIQPGARSQRPGEEISLVP
jgi:ATP-dependent exoDNAse (exonuclease V) alpha subunit